ncbi:MAG: transcriptional repressor [Rhodospirillaceae bacterium TMED8]|nr:transcriptional repressor [Magnetovibrio sp.]OUT50447.1 MAG: transcriptional repressor [Rhodospirillaceae bacterium TMED8]
MSTNDCLSGTIRHLLDAGVRPTRHRLALAELLFDGRERHVSAEMLNVEAREHLVSISLATVYNTLHHFTAAGLLREIVVDSRRGYFDTNTSDHYHFFYEDSLCLVDIPIEALEIMRLPATPAGKTIRRVEVVVRVSG